MERIDEEVIIDRRKNPQTVVISELQIEEIAERAADKAVERIVNDVYQQIGKTIVDKMLWLIGVVTLGAFSYALSNGWISSK
jgi:tetrahydromethanopterin S-methyltransferase subunit G